MLVGYGRLDSATRQRLVPHQCWSAHARSRPCPTSVNAYKFGIGSRLTQRADPPAERLTPRNAATSEVRIRPR